MKKNLFLSLFVMSLMACSTDEDVSKSVPTRQTGSEIIFDDILLSRAQDIDILTGGRLPDGESMGIFFVDDVEKNVWYKNQKYNISDNEGFQKFIFQQTDDFDKLYYPVSAGISAFAYLPYIDESKRPSDIFTLEGAKDIDTPYTPLTLNINYRDQLTEEEYRQHDVTYGIINNMKEDDETHRFAMIHLNYRMQLTVDITGLSPRNLSELKNATLELLQPYSKVSYKVNIDTDGKLSLSSPTYTGNPVTQRILDFGTPTSINQQFVTTFCIPPFTLKANTPIFRLRFANGTTKDFVINSTKDKTFKSNQHISYTLYLYAKPIIIGAKMDSWGGTVVMTGSSEDDPTDLVYE